MTEFPRIAVGSIVRVTAPGSRSTDGEPCQIPAIVLKQWEEDGTVVLFAFHFEGQYMGSAGAGDVEVLFDAGAGAQPSRALALLEASLAAAEGRLDALRETVQDDLRTLQRQMQEFQEQVLTMITQPTAPLPPGPEPLPIPDVESTRKPGAARRA